MKNYLGCSCPLSTHTDEETVSALHLQKEKQLAAQGYEDIFPAGTLPKYVGGN